MLFSKFQTFGKLVAYSCRVIAGNQSFRNYIFIHSLTALGTQQSVKFVSKLSWVRSLFNVRFRPTAVIQARFMADSLLMESCQSILTKQLSLSVKTANYWASRCFCPMIFRQTYHFHVGTAKMRRSTFRHQVIGQFLTVSLIQG
jgi:hypothetical protein